MTLHENRAKEDKFCPTFFLSYFQRRRCGWSRIYLCCRFGKQSHSNFPSRWKFFACVWFMGIGRCRIQRTWRCGNHVEWKYFGLRSGKSSCTSILAERNGKYFELKISWIHLQFPWHTLLRLIFYFVLDFILKIECPCEGVINNAKLLQVISNFRFDFLLSARLTAMFTNFYLFSMEKFFNFS